MTTRTIWQTFANGTVVYRGSSKTRAFELANRLDNARVLSHDEPTPQASKTPANTPYPWCRDPARCQALGYCPQNPCCGD
jgi:hypothetical protein